jgi:hypothetical protein
MSTVLPKSDRRELGRRGRKKNRQQGSSKPKLAAADLIVGLALETHRFGVTEKREPFAVAKDGPCVAVLLKEYAGDLKASLAAAFRRRHESVPSQAALANAITVLQGEAQSGDVEDVFLRVAWHHGELVIDIGDDTGRAVVVTPGIGWEVVGRAPVLFRRSSLTAPLPIPERRGDLRDLRQLINVSDKSWPIVVGWLLAAYIPDIPHPVLSLSGTQGTGKSCFAQTLLELFDPSTAPRGPEPRDPDRWHERAQNVWGVILDNLSGIRGWLSDLLCKSVTGDASIRRRLYSNGDLVVSEIRNVVILTAIDTGALRGDLGERLCRLELDPIPPTRRIDERQLKAIKNDVLPGVFGALLDALVKTLGRLPDIDLPTLPRMADFAKVLAAADEAGVTSEALGGFLGQQEEIGQDVLDSDPFGGAVKTFMQQRASWVGSASDLLDEMWPDRQLPRPREWPKAQGVSGALKRLIPQFKSDGIDIVFERGGGKQRKRLIRITVVAESEPTSLQVSGVESGELTTAPAFVGDPSLQPWDDDIPF